MGLSASFMYFLFSDYIINIIYGDNYINASKYLKWYGFAILPMSIILILENFFIAKNQLVFSWIFILVSPFQVLAIYIFHNSLYDILISIFVCSLLVLLIGMIYILSLYKNRGVL
jgi:O-antigen/teichoic acid export membrane protein